MKKISFSFKNHFIHRLYAYIIAAVAIPSIVTYGVILKTNPKAEEMFTIFVEANINDSSSFKDFIRNNTNEKNKEITTYSCLSSMNTYEVVYQTQGLESDLLILSENAFRDDYSSNYVELSTENSFYGSTNKMVNDKHFGIQIFDGSNGHLSNYIKYKENINYYIFINKNSVHISRFSNAGKTEQIYTLLEAIYNEK